MNPASAGTPDLHHPRSDEPALSYHVKIMYGVGEIANSIKVVTFGLYSLFFVTTVMGLPGTWIGAVAFFTIFWDAAIDPFIGYLTDGPKARTRRYRFMLTGGLTMGAGFWAFFSPPLGLSPVTLLAWLFVSSLLVRTATSMFSIPYYAVGANLSQDYDERTSIAAIRSIANSIGTLLTASLSFVVFFPQKVQGVDPKLERSGYAWMGLSFGFIMTLVALVAVSGTLPYRHRFGRGSDQEPLSPKDFLQSMWMSLGNRSFRVLLVCLSMVTVGLAVNSSLLIHFLKYYVAIDGSAALSSSQAAFFGTGLLGLTFWMRIYKRLDKHHLFAVSASITGVVILSTLPLVGQGRPFGTGNVVPVLAGCGLAGFFNSVLWFLPQSMLADVADECELLVGERRDGALFGTLSFIQQVATGLAVLLAGLLLDRFAGLVPGKAQQAASTVQRIGVIYSLLPGMLLLAGALLMSRYKLTRSRLKCIQNDLQNRGSSVPSATAGLSASA